MDEGAWLTEKAWKALRQCLKAGGKLRIYSTPNGLRDTTYYRLTTSSQFKVFRWPSWINPDWSDDRESELLEFYGGRDTAGWQHEVAGEHGKPSYGAFSLENLNICRQETLEYRKVTLLGEDLASCQTEEESHDRLEILLNLMPQTGVFWIGGDLGYTNDPTELVVFREMEIGDRSVMTLALRIHMEHVSYPYIAQTIALLDRYYTPVGIGVDNGGNGLSVVQELLTLDKYKPLQLDGRLRGYDFGGMTTLASGIRSAIMAPYEAAKSVLARIRRLLPFSDAKEGPLSSLTASGMAMLHAFSAGIDRASEIPAKAVSRSLLSARRIMNASLMSGVVTGTLALSPTIAGAMPNLSAAPMPVVSSVSADQPVDNNVQSQTRLLAETRGVASRGTGLATTGRTDDLQSVISVLCAKLDSISERPIEIQVTTTLDGRKIAQSVYKDMRERKVKNYETI